MKTQERTFAHSPGYLWTPDGQPEAVILVLHGMTEHAGRYADLARALTDAGFAVASYDLRGHGRNAPSSDCAAMAPGDWEKSVNDIELAMEALDGLFCGLPIYLLGFSLGSFLAREYLERPGIRADGVILVGTGWQPGWLLKLMASIVKGQIKKAGFEHTTPLVQQLSFGAYNQKFKPNRTGSDWLCADTAELDRYLADPLCRSRIASGTFYELLRSMERTGRQPETRAENALLPILLLSGGDDPVGDFGKGSEAVRRMLVRAGYPVSAECYPGARHILLSEYAGGQAGMAIDELISWLKAHL